MDYKSNPIRNQTTLKAEEIIKNLCLKHNLLSDFIEKSNFSVPNQFIKKVQNILLLDDDPILSFLTGKILNKVDFTISLHSYSSCHEGIEFLRSSNNVIPEIIFLDLNMPDTSGWDFLDTLRKLNVTSKVVIYTSSIDPLDIEKAKQYPEVWDYVIKPLDEQKMKKLISRL